METIHEEALIVQTDRRPLISWTGTAAVSTAVSAGTSVGAAGAEASQQQLTRTVETAFR